MSFYTIIHNNDFIRLNNHLEPIYSFTNYLIPEYLLSTYESTTRSILVDTYKHNITDNFSQISKLDIYNNLTTYNIPSSFKSKYDRSIVEVLNYIDDNSTETVLYLRELSNKMSFEGFKLTIHKYTSINYCLRLFPVWSSYNVDIQLDIYREIYID